MPKTYTVKEVARILGFSTNSIYGFLKEGRIQGIRIGQGRFRIPEDELARIMHLSKVASVPVTQPTQSFPVLPQEPISLPLVLPTAHHESLSLFDWFISGIAILSAFSLMLYSSTTTILMTLGIWKAIVVVGVLLVLSAIGLCITVFWKGVKSPVRFPFLVGICIGLSVLSTIHLMLQNRLYGFFLATFVISILFAFLSRMRTMVALCMSTCIFSLAYPIVIFLEEEYVYFPILANLGYPARVILAIGVSLSWMGLCLAAWATRRSHKIVSIVIFSTLSVALFAISLACAVNLHWSSAIVLLWISILLPVLPYWDYLRFQSGKMQLIVTGAYSLILFITLCCIFVVHFMQQATLTNARQQLMTNLQVGTRTVETIVATDTKNLHNIAQNQAFAKAIEENDMAATEGYLRTLLDGRGAVESVHIVSLSGDLVLMYPPGDESNASTIGLRDYITTVLNSGNTVISDVRISSKEPQRYIFTTAVPIKNAQNDTIGVLAANSNMASFSLALTKVANSSIDEQFRITDTAGRFIVHETASQLLSFVEDDKNKNSLLIAAYEDIQSPLWKIGAQAPITQILAKMEGFWFLLGSVYLIALFYIAVAGFFVGIHRKSSIPLRQGESPG